MNSAQPILPVVIIGGGPVGLTLSALLSKFKIRHRVIEADSGYCTGSRAICVSRRSQEILAWVGADAAVVQKALGWVGGRTYYRDQEILHFKMPSSTQDRFAPMVNIQQYYIEQYAHEAAQRLGDYLHMSWSTRLMQLNPNEHGATIEVACNGVTESLQAQFVIACDGGRSTVRELMGLQLEGRQYEGRYVIVDIEQKSARNVERLAWFDPPSNPGSTLLMHRQPDDVWRIDYQVRDDEDPAEAVKPENVLPRVQSHLTMIGENEPWKPLWISIYNAKCLTLPKYRYGRVFFAGDAGHLVPIFGVRGLNSGLDDVGNLAWKLARVLQQPSSHLGLNPNMEQLLDSYSHERVFATHENMAYGAKSTEFMAPPHAGFELMRQAALRLSLENEQVRSLANPRQSTPIIYSQSPLNISPISSDSLATEKSTGAGPQAGEPAPDVAVFNVSDASKKLTYLSQLFGEHFVLLHFTQHVEKPSEAALDHQQKLQVNCVCLAASEPAWERYAANNDHCILVRPDGYIAGRWSELNWASINTALAFYAPTLTPTNKLS